MDEATLNNVEDLTTSVDKFMSEHSHLDVIRFRQWRELCGLTNMVITKFRKRNRTNKRQAQQLLSSEIKTNMQLVEQIDKVTKNNKTMNEQVINMQEELSKLYLKLAIITEVNASLNKDVNSLTTKVDHLTSENNEMKADINKLRFMVRHPKQHRLVKGPKTKVYCNLCDNWSSSKVCQDCPTMPGMHDHCFHMQRHIDHWPEVGAKFADASDE